MHPAQNTTKQGVFVTHTHFFRLWWEKSTKQRNLNKIHSSSTMQAAPVKYKEQSRLEKTFVNSNSSVVRLRSILIRVLNYGPLRRNWLPLYVQHMKYRSRNYDGGFAKDIASLAFRFPDAAPSVVFRGTADRAAPCFVESDVLVDGGLGESDRTYWGVGWVAAGAALVVCACDDLATKCWACCLRTCDKEMQCSGSISDGVAPLRTQ